MNDWHYCESCDSEFKVVSDTVDQEEVIAFCPYCGTEMEEQEDEDEEDLDYWGIED